MGTLALSDSFLIRRGGAWSTLVTAVPLLEDDGSAMAVDVVDAPSVLTRFAGGDVGGEVICSEVVVIVL